MVPSVRPDRGVATSLELSGESLATRPTWSYEVLLNGLAASRELALGELGLAAESA